MYWFFPDINECLLKSHQCKLPSKCRNTIGDYKCECPSGYKIDALKNCVGKCYICQIYTIYFAQ